VSYFVIRTAETWSVGSIFGLLLLLAIVISIITAAFFVTRNR
jgi:hypothetical protein